MAKDITRKRLKKWQACESGYKRFCQLFPQGADLKTASVGLIQDGHTDWSNWLWEQCKQDGDYADQTTVAAGKHGTATAGKYGTATAGNYGTVAAGDYGASTTGYEGTATVGYKGTATAGDWGSATVGYEGNAIAGDEGTAIAGNGGTATVGEQGVISIIFYSRKKQKHLRKIGAIGENGLKPNVAYKLDKDGNFIEVEK